MSVTKVGVSLDTFHRVNSRKTNASFDRDGKGGLLILHSADNTLIPTPLIQSLFNGQFTNGGQASGNSLTYQTLEDLLDQLGTIPTIAEPARTAYSQGFVPQNVTVGFYDPAAPIAPQLDSIRACSSDFFAIISPNLKDDPFQVDIAAWANAFSPNHIYSALTCDPDALQLGDTTSIGAQISAAGFNTLVNYQDPSFTGYLDAEAAGYVSGQNFDVIPNYTLFETQLTGTPASPTTATQLNALDSNNINSKVCIVGPNIDVYTSGVLGDGSFVDTCHKNCWLNSRLAEAQLSGDLLEGPPPGTREGYQYQIDRYEDILLDAEDRGVIASYTITAPRFESISVSQLASRNPVCISAQIVDTRSIHGSCLNLDFIL